MVALRNRSETGGVAQESFLTQSFLTALTASRECTPVGNEEACQLSDHEEADHV